jgi:hypothetical protein
MSEISHDYYSRLVAGIGANDIQQWEDQIAEAEKQRFDDRSVMDIIGSGTPELTTDGTESVPTQTVTSEWIQLALEIEEKQCGGCTCFTMN